MKISSELSNRLVSKFPSLSFGIVEVRRSLITDCTAFFPFKSTLTQEHGYRLLHNARMFKAAQSKQEQEQDKEKVHMQLHYPALHVIFPLFQVPKLPIPGP